MDMGFVALGARPKGKPGSKGETGSGWSSFEFVGGSASEQSQSSAPSSAESSSKRQRVVSSFTVVPDEFGTNDQRVQKLHTLCRELRALDQKLLNTIAPAAELQEPKPEPTPQQKPEAETAATTEATLEKPQANVMPQAKPEREEKASDVAAAPALKTAQPEAPSVLPAYFEKHCTIPKVYNTVFSSLHCITSEQSVLAIGLVEGFSLFDRLATGLVMHFLIKPCKLAAVQVTLFQTTARTMKTRPKQRNPRLLI